MKTEINFYQIDDVITKALAPLLTKIAAEKKRGFIYCNNNELLNEIDDSLWSYGKNRFIAHYTKRDAEVIKEFGFDNQAFFIDSTPKNLNSANYLILVSEAEIPFISSFERVFYFYENTDSKKIENFKNQLQASSKFDIKSYKKNDGKWVLC